MNTKSFVIACVAAFSCLSPLYGSDGHYLHYSDKLYELVSYGREELVKLSQEEKLLDLRESYITELENNPRMAKEEQAKRIFWIGVCFFAQGAEREDQSGEGGKEEYKMALTYISEAAHRKYLIAMTNMAYFYYYGRLVKLDHTEAFKWCNAAAAFETPSAKGLAKAQYLLAHMYLEGKGTNKNPDVARKWLGCAAVNGSAPAHRDLGLLLLQANESQKAVLCLKLAADLGDGQAHYVLAELYTEGKGVRQDDYEASKHLCLAMGRQYPPAKAKIMGYMENGPWETLLQLASYYGQAYGQAKFNQAQPNIAVTEQDKRFDLIQRTSFRLYAAAAKHGSAEGYLQCGEAHRLGRGVTKDQKKAIVSYVASAKRGNLDALKRLETLSGLNVAFAIHELGLLCILGNGIKQDTEKGFELLAALLPKNNPKPLLNPADLDDIKKRDTFALLGRLYLTGDGVEKDSKKAALFLTGAADLGCHESEFELAQLYEKGEGVKQSLKNAIIRYYFLAEGVHAKALERLERLSDSGATMAKYMLGVLYTYGKGVEVSYEKAFEMFSAVLPNILDLDKDRRRKTFTLLGWMYLQGEGVEEDTTTAATFLLKASLFGCDWSRFELAQLFENGDGVMKNTDWAYRLYEHCAAKGDERAKEKLADLVMNRHENTTDPQHEDTVE